MTFSFTVSITLGAVAIGAPMRIVAAGTAGSGQSLSGTAPDVPRHSSRLVHQFDFDERALGNLEDVPKYWEPLRSASFPHYTYGRFDFEVGHPYPPSFYLASEGRNVAYQYVGPELSVTPAVPHRIAAFIREDHLSNARACLSAHYLNALGQPIAGTLARSRYVGTPDVAPSPTADPQNGTTSRPAGWESVEIYLSPAPPEADRIGLTVWILQQPTWNNGVKAPWQVPRRDVRGGAWFDGISVFALPIAQITTGVAGNVLAPDDPLEIHVRLEDKESSSIRARLTISGADGEDLETHPLPLTTKSGGTFSLPVGHLEPGLYRARLEVVTGGSLLAEQELTFARLGAFDRIGRKGGDVTSAFGIVLDSKARGDPHGERRLLQGEMIRCVKLAVWPDLAPGTTPSERSDGAELLSELTDHGFALTGVFYGPPDPPEGGLSSGRQDGKTLLELLAGGGSGSESRLPTDIGRALAATVAPLAGFVRWWQLGGDEECGIRRDGGPDVQRDSALLRSALRTLDDSLSPLMADPRLTMGIEIPVCAHAIPMPPGAVTLDVQQVALGLPAGLAPPHVRDLITRLVEQGYKHVSAYVPPSDPEQYQRLPRLAEWAQRVITARHAGARTVFVPQTWAVRETPDGALTEPLETYVVLRTIAALIGDAEPGPVVPIGDRITALAFYEGDNAVLALWGDQSTPGTRVHAVQLGSATEQVDLWGRQQPLSRDGQGRQLIRLSSLPVIIPGLDRWLVELGAAVELTPSHLESGAGPGRHRLRVTYSGRRPITARISLHGPSEWRISPRVFHLALRPGDPVERHVDIRYPHNEPAGRKTIVARMELSDSPAALEVPLTVDVDLSNVPVTGFAAVEGSDLVLRQIVTNQTKQTISFRGFAVVPGRERQHRPMPVLRPGETQTVEYRFDDAHDLIGRKVRLVLREASDGPRSHTLELVIP